MAKMQEKIIPGSGNSARARTQKWKKQDCHVRETARLK